MGASFVWQTQSAVGTRYAGSKCVVCVWDTGKLITGCQGGKAPRSVETHCVVQNNLTLKYSLSKSETGLPIIR
jgi:hypothetical protein